MKGQNILVVRGSQYFILAVGALVLLALTGMAIYFSLDRGARWLLSHWHESALPDEE